jgi:hypothetical protein
MQITSTMIKTSLVAIGIIFSVGLTTPSSSYAQAASGCGINQAADAAVQKQIAMLDAAKVNASEFFNGVSSCLGSGLLNNLDLSRLIPTSFDFVGQAGEQIIQSVMSKAQQQVCEVVNKQLQKVVGKINEQLGKFESLLGGQLNDLLGGNSSSISAIKIPDIRGIGEVSFTPEDNSTTPAVSGPTTAPPPANTGQTNNLNTGNGAPAPSSSPSPFSGLFEQLLDR